MSLDLQMHAFIRILQKFNVLDALPNSMDSDCQICRETFDLADHRIVNICKNKHQCCIYCFDTMFFVELRRKCPFCKIHISEQQLIYRMNEAQQNRSKRAIDHRRQIVVKFMYECPELSHRDKNAMIWKDFRQIRQAYNKNLAIAYLKGHIEDSSDEYIEKQSNIQHQFENNIEVPGYSWLEKRYNIASLSLYDQLTVSFLVQGCGEADRQWYDKIIQKNPNDYRPILGRAYHIQRAKSAMQFKNQFLKSKNYQQIIQLKPSFDKSYEIFAFMYLEENDLTNAQQLATQCIKRNPNNIQAEYILAISNKVLTSFEVQTRLLKIINKQPMFLRARHSYGKELSKSGQYYEALEYFDACLSINRLYITPLIDKAATLSMLSKHNEAINILQNTIMILQRTGQLLKQQKFKNLHLSCKYYIGVAYENSGQFNKALPIFEQVYPNHNIRKEKLGDICLRIQKWTDALDHFKYYKQRWCSISIIQKAVQYCDRLGQIKKQDGLTNNMPFEIEISQLS